MTQTYAGPHAGTPLGLIGYAGQDAILDRFYWSLDRNPLTEPYFRGHDIHKIKAGLRPIIRLVLTAPGSIDVAKLFEQMARIHSGVINADTGQPVTNRVYDVVGRLLIHSIGIEFAPFDEHDAVVDLAGKIYESLRPAIVQA